MDVKVAVGMSQARDSRTAGKEAAQIVKDQLGSEQVVFAIVMAAPTFEQQVLLDGITSVLSVPLVGGSVNGEISNNGVTEYSVVVLGFAGQGMKFYPVLLEKLTIQLDKAGSELGTMLAAGLANEPPVHQTVLLWVDGLVGMDLERLIAETAQRCGKAVEIVGMLTADEGEFKQTFQYYNGLVYSGAAVGVVVSGEFVTASGARAGWQSLGNRLTCTHSEGITVLELNERPALEMYKQYLGPERSLSLPLISWQYPWGVMAEHEGGSVPSNGSSAKQNFASESLELRPLVGIDEARQGLKFMTVISEGTEMTITAASRNDLIQSAAEMSRELKEKLLGAKLLLAINFSGLGRKLVLGSRMEEEWQAIVTELGKEVPLIGGIGLGEIGANDLSHKDMSVVELGQQTCRLWVVGTHEY